MTDHPSPRVSRSPRIPLVWLVPLASFVIAAWMLFAEFRQHGPEIVVDFTDGSGVEPGKTQLHYKGVSVGVVREVELKPNLLGVSVHVRLNRDAAPLAKTGARFWIVQPEISFGAIRGLDTILTGARINVLPGDGPPAAHFVGLERPPLPRSGEGGRTFILDSVRRGSIGVGSPVFYRGVKVGLVEDTRLARDSASVRIRIRIETPYVDLVRTNTRFWNAGGLDFKLSLFGGGSLKNTSLESLINGGVAFATPDTTPLAPPAADGGEFPLADNPDESWLEWRPKIPIQTPERPAQNDGEQSPQMSPILISTEPSNATP